MKKVRLTTIMVMAFISLSAMSCKDAKTENSTNSEMITEEDHSKMNHDNSDGHHDVDKKEMAMNGDGNSQTILNDYFNLKDALVADDNAKAKELGATLATSLGKLDISVVVFSVSFLVSFLQLVKPNAAITATLKITFLLTSITFLFLCS